jgi:hypothetical protein
VRVNVRYHCLSNTQFLVIEASNLISLYAMILKPWNFVPPRLQINTGDERLRAAKYITLELLDRIGKYYKVHFNPEAAHFARVGELNDYHMGDRVLLFDQELPARRATPPEKSTSKRKASQAAENVKPAQRFRGSTSQDV